MPCFTQSSSAGLKFLQINGVGAVKYKKYGEQFLALINTLRTNDFQEPEYKKVAQVELEYETSKPKQPDADLHKTYHLTLALIQQGSSVEEIMKNRDFATSTVLGHINKLVEENLIGEVQRRTLFSQVRQNPVWVKTFTHGISLGSIVMVTKVFSYIILHLVCISFFIFQLFVYR
jgi:ATP-dependent DNA helicase RecQ